MTINWAALGVVAAVSLVIGVLVVVLVSLALVGLSAREPNPPGEPADHTPRVITRTGNGLSRTAGTVITATCLLGATTIVLSGSTFSPSDRNAAPGRANDTTGAAGLVAVSETSLQEAPLVARGVVGVGGLGDLDRVAERRSPEPLQRVDDLQALSLENPWPLPRAASKDENLSGSAVLVDAWCA